MALADRILARYRREFARVGAPIAIRRFTGTGPSRTYVDTTAMAREIAFNPTEMTGAVAQGDIRIIALADTLASLFPLDPLSDKVVVRGQARKIKGVDDKTRRIAGTLIALVIHAEG